LYESLFYASLNIKLENQLNKMNHGKKISSILDSISQNSEESNNHDAVTIEFLKQKLKNSEQSKKNLEKCLNKAHENIEKMKIEAEKMIYFSSSNEYKNFSVMNEEEKLKSINELSNF
jgi:hypothetical protein